MRRRVWRDEGAPAQRPLPSPMQTRPTAARLVDDCAAEGATRGVSGAVRWGRAFA